MEPSATRLRLTPPQAGAEYLAMRGAHRSYAPSLKLYPEVPPKFLNLGPQVPRNNKHSMGMYGHPPYTRGGGGGLA